MGTISPQFHVHVFEDSFSTVPSLNENEEVPSFWSEIELAAHIFQVPLDESSILQLGNEWLAPEELQQQSRAEKRETCVRQSFIPPS